jgi:hypothetical protein
MSYYSTLEERNVVLLYMYANIDRMNYETMENQLRATQDVLTAEQEDHRAR